MIYPLYFGNRYCYNFEDFVFLLNSFDKLNENRHSAPLSLLNKWLCPLIEDGVLSTWLENQSSQQAKNLNGELNAFRKKKSNIETEKVVNRILVDLGIDWFFE